ncbi:hypothetical protein B0H17DRAFT_1259016 [Mycena rosella]|uniref:Uncharacterized protein n=1 Tax=Mycena rosella TaxID=1033263 RepID=A0AAD7GK64_MYCRO|nr:hypothetical protein B0H17DRAFT_1259016 [Mycena rosella]
MSGNPPPTSFPPLDDTLGAVEIGTGFCTLLFGIVTLQTFNYYRLFPTDSGFLKLLELGHTISAWHGVREVHDQGVSSLLYSLTVTFFGQPQYINDPPHSIEMTILFSAPTYFIVQMFFAHRIRTLSGRWPITIICAVLAFARAAVIIAMFTITLNLSQLSDLAANYPGLMATALSLGVVVDFIVAASMCYYLRNLRTKGVKLTKRMVDTLIVWTIGQEPTVCVVDTDFKVYLRNRHGHEVSTFSLSSNCAFR